METQAANEKETIEQTTAHEMQTVLREDVTATQVETQELLEHQEETQAITLSDSGQPMTSIDTDNLEALGITIVELLCVIIGTLWSNIVFNRGK